MVQKCFSYREFSSWSRKQFLDQAFYYFILYWNRLDFVAHIWRQNREQCWVVVHIYDSIYVLISYLPSFLTLSHEQTEKYLSPLYYRSKLYLGLLKALSQLSVQKWCLQLIGCIHRFTFLPHNFLLYLHVYILLLFQGRWNLQFTEQQLRNLHLTHSCRMTITDQLQKRGFTTKTHPFLNKYYHSLATADNSCPPVKAPLGLILLSSERAP